MVPIAIKRVEQCRAKVYVKLITKFLNKNKKSIIFLITPPLYLSQNCIQEAKKTFDYITFYDIVKNAEYEATKSVLLHLYLPMEDCAKQLKNYDIIFNGYTKEGIKYEELRKIYEVKMEETKGEDVKLNKVDKNLLKMKPDRLEIFHKKIQNSLRVMFKQLESEGVKYNIMAERSEKLIDLIKEKYREILE